MGAPKHMKYITKFFCFRLPGYIVIIKMKNINGFENYHPRINAIDVLKGIGGAACELFRMHLLSPVSDHKFVHPLDEVFDQPVYTQEVLLTENLSGFGTVPDIQGREL